MTLVFKASASSKKRAFVLRFFLNNCLQVYWRIKTLLSLNWQILKVCF